MPRRRPISAISFRRSGGRGIPRSLRSAMFPASISPGVQMRSTPAALGAARRRAQKASTEARKASTGSREAMLMARKKWATRLRPELSPSALTWWLKPEPASPAMRASMRMERPLPLCPAMGQRRALLRTTLGSVVGWPSASRPQPSGIFFPAWAAWRT